VIHTPAKPNIIPRVLKTLCAKLVIDFGLPAKGIADVLSSFVLLIFKKIPVNP
jgi:hypothetical protein